MLVDAANTGSSTTNDSASSTAESVSASTNEDAEVPPPGSVVAVCAARARTTDHATPSGDEVLVAGGCVVDGGCGEASDETFVVSNDVATIVAGPSMSVPRDSHTPTLLNDGRVVLIGGYPAERLGVLDSIDVIDPLSMTTAVQTPLAQARGGHAAAASVSGDVLVVGGWISSRNYTASAELFEPTTGRVRSVGGNCRRIVGSGRL